MRNNIIAGGLLTVLLTSFNLESLAVPVGSHDDPFIFGPTRVTQSITPEVNTDNNFFDTFYFDVVDRHLLLDSTVTPSPDFAGFDGGVFDNTVDAWRGRYLDPENDGTYTLFATDLSGNLDVNNLMPVTLPLDPLGYHLHFFTSNNDAQNGLGYEFSVTAAVPLPATIWLLFAGVIVAATLQLKVLNQKIA